MCVCVCVYVCVCVEEEEEEEGYYMFASIFLHLLTLKLLSFPSPPGSVTCISTCHINRSKSNISKLQGPMLCSTCSTSVLWCVDVHA